METENINVKNRDNYTPLYYAASYGTQKTVQLLLENGAKVDVRNESNYNYTSLHYAARNGKTEIAQLLLKNGADVNFIDNDGDTALIMATIQRNIDIVRLLLDRGAKSNIGND